MKRLLATLVLAAAGGTAAAPPALAQEADQPAPAAAGAADAREAVGSGMFLPGFQPAAPSVALANVSAYGGFDGARRTPVFGATAELALRRWLAVRAGVTYMPNGPDDRSNVRPNITLRANLLEQGRAGVDLSLSGTYRQERFAEDGGLLELGAVAGHRGEHVALIGRASFASDPEGDDREGELGAAALYRASAALHLGAQGFVRRDLGSTDARRAMRNDTRFDFEAGPVASYARAGLVLTLHTGVVGLQGETSNALGLLAVGGVGAVF